MLAIRFNFDFAKAMQAMAFFVMRLHRVEKVKLTKLLYIADKQHFLDAGFPITGDRQYAMRWGPVPSDCLHALNGEFWPRPDEAFNVIHVENNDVTLRHDPGTNLLTRSELRVLEDVFQLHASKDKWGLVGETHRYPEYVEAYIDGTSRPISYEAILKHSGRQAHFHADRPVISSATLERITCPFPGSETDL